MKGGAMLTKLFANEALQDVPHSLIMVQCLVSGLSENKIQGVPKKVQRETKNESKIYPVIFH